MTLVSSSHAHAVGIRNLNLLWRFFMIFNFWHRFHSGNGFLSCSLHLWARCIITIYTQYWHTSPLLSPSDIDCIAFRKTFTGSERHEVIRSGWPTCSNFCGTYLRVQVLVHIPLKHFLFVKLLSCLYLWSEHWKVQCTVICTELHLSTDSGLSHNEVGLFIAWWWSRVRKEWSEFIERREKEAKLNTEKASRKWTFLNCNSGKVKVGIKRYNPMSW